MNKQLIIIKFFANSKAAKISQGIFAAFINKSEWKDTSRSPVYRKPDPR